VEQIVNKIKALQRKRALLLGGAFLIVLAAAFSFCLVFFPCPDRPPQQINAEKPGPEIFLESFFKNKELYEEAFARVGKAEKSQVRAGIVPHHFLARDLIAAFFQGIASPSVSRVILVGPDHFKSFSGTDPLSFTTLLPWRTPFGGLEPDRRFIQHLASEDACLGSDKIFMRDHSIWVLVPFVKKAFPQAHIVPLVLRNNREYARFRELGETLARLDDQEGILVVSSDFSHGVSQDQAMRLDRESITNLGRLDLDHIARIHCDCRPCLAVLLGFLGEEQSFRLLDRQTSRDLGAPPGEPLTSYVSGYYCHRRQAASVLFVGDLFFDRHIRRVAERKGYDFLFRQIKGLLDPSDLVVANLEGPITDKAPVSRDRGPGEPDHYCFTFAPEVAETLARHRINLVNLGNNHILDFGAGGLRHTRRYLDRAGVSYFGVPGSPEGKSLVKDLGGWKWGFISFNQFAAADVGSTLKEIDRLKEEADFIVVYAHWGLEYSQTPGPRVREWARSFVDHGADLVIGSHPHVVQEKESYRGKWIYYSLGNFVFDQYFRQDTARGLAVKATVRPRHGRLELEEIPLSLERRGQTRVISSRP
jgi:AmmeMemoRadiSam system protein B